MRNGFYRWNLLGFQDVVVNDQKDDGECQQPDDREVELAARQVGDRLRGINCCFPFDSLRRELECPGQDHGQREARNNEKHQ